MGELLFMGGDPVRLGQGHADFIKAVDQAVTTKIVDLKLEPVLIRGCNNLVFQIDIDRIGLGDLHQPVDGLLRMTQT